MSHFWSSLPCRKWWILISTGPEVRMQHTQLPSGWPVAKHSAAFSFSSHFHIAFCYAISSMKAMSVLLISDLSRTFEEPVGSFTKLECTRNVSHVVLPMLRTTVLTDGSMSLCSVGGAPSSPPPEKRHWFLCLLSTTQKSWLTTKREGWTPIGGHAHNKRVHLCPLVVRQHHSQW